MESAGREGAGGEVRELGIVGDVVGGFGSCNRLVLDGVYTDRDEVSRHSRYLVHAVPSPKSAARSPSKHTDPSRAASRAPQPARTHPNPPKPTLHVSHLVNTCPITPATPLPRYPAPRRRAPGAPRTRRLAPAQLRAATSRQITGTRVGTVAGCGARDSAVGWRLGSRVWGRVWGLLCGCPGVDCSCCRGRVAPRIARSRASVACGRHWTYYRRPQGSKRPIYGL